MPRTIQQLFDLTGKTALVTGGSRGLGLQMAHALGEAGARVVISSRKAGDLAEATAELQAADIDARWIAADCSLEEDIRRLGDSALMITSSQGLPFVVHDWRALDRGSKRLLERFL